MSVILFFLLVLSPFAVMLYGLLTILAALRGRKRQAGIMASIPAVLVPTLIAVLWFYPPGATPVVGPAGPWRRAFIADNSSLELSYVLYASDWPHTFLWPVRMVETYNTGERILWSADGTLLLVGREASYTCAYDYLAHEFIPGDSFRIARLVEERGGAGPGQDRYPDGKDKY